MKNRVRLLSILLVGVMALSGCSMSASNNNGDKKSDTKKETVKKDKKKKSDKKKDEKKLEIGFKNNMAVTKNLNLKITDYKILKPKDKGNEVGKTSVIVFYFDVTNKSDKKYSPGIAWSEVFKEGISQEIDGKKDILDENFKVEKSLAKDDLKNIEKGKTVSSAMAYSLSDEKADVMLYAFDGDKEIGKQAFKLNK